MNMKNSLKWDLFDGRRWKNGVKLKSRGKLDPRVDWEEEYYLKDQYYSPAEYLGHDFLDGGTAFNWRLVTKVLESFIGRPWDELYSELCQVVGSKGYRAYKLKRRFKGYINGVVCIDDQGIIQRKPPRKYIPIARHQIVRDGRVYQEWYFPDKRVPCRCNAELCRRINQPVYWWERRSLILGLKQPCNHGNIPRYYTKFVEVLKEVSTGFFYGTTRVRRLSRKEEQLIKEINHVSI